VPGREPDNLAAGNGSRGRAGSRALAGLGPDGTAEAWYRGRDLARNSAIARLEDGCLCWKPGSLVSQQLKGADFQDDHTAACNTSIAIDEVAS
jgi:hypothetical protein